MLALREIASGGSARGHPWHYGHGSQNSHGREKTAKCLSLKNRNRVAVALRAVSPHLRLPNSNTKTNFLVRSTPNNFNAIAAPLVLRQHWVY